MPEKPHILHLIEGLERGGAELRLLEDVRSLNQFRHSVCYLFEDKEGLTDDFRSSGARVYCLSIRRKIDFLSGFFRFLKIIGACRPDIIHSHLFFANIISRISCLFYPKIHCVSTIHFPEYINDGSIVYSRIRHLIELFTLFLKRPNFIAVSAYLKRESIKSLGIKNKEITVIYNYLNDSWFDNGLSLKDVSPKRIISVGRLEKQKGFDYLVRAMRRVLDSTVGVSLSIIGDGSERKALSNLIKQMELDKNVDLLGKRSDIRELILQGGIFIFPSLNEGLGVALIEAMSQGRICLAFNVGPIPEIIEDGYDGFLVPPKDEQALSQKIIYVIDNYPLCRDIAMRAQLKARKKFTKEASAKLLGDYYSAILNRN